MNRSKTPETQARWDRWANRIAAEVASRYSLAAVDKLLEANKTALERRDKRIAELEQRLELLETAVAGERVIEWPLQPRKSA